MGFFLKETPLPKTSIFSQPEGVRSSTGYVGVSTQRVLSISGPFVDLASSGTPPRPLQSPKASQTQGNPLKSPSSQTVDQIHLPMETCRKVFLGIPTLLKRTGNTVSIRPDVWKHEFHKSILKVGADRAVLNGLAL